MDCQEVEREEIAERYLLHQLSDSEQELFEQHYFACDACYEQVEQYRRLQAELGRDKTGGGAELRAATTPWRWAVAVAAGLAVVLGIAWWFQARRRPTPSPGQAVITPRPSAQPARPDLGALARVVPPTYEEPVLRGGSGRSDAGFRAAMRHYRAGEYMAAVPGLRASVPGTRADEARFYLAICYLMTSNTDEAITELRPLAASRDAMIREAAHFYLAKAFLRNRDIIAATSELQETISINGDLRAQAEEILRALKPGEAR